MELEVRAAARAGDRLDAGGDVLVALAHVDGVEGHPQRLQGGRAEPVDGRGGDVVVDAREQAGVATHVVALLALAEPAAHHDVVGLGEVDVRVALHQRPERDGGQIVRADVAERPLDRPPDGGANGVDDHGFRHGCGLLGRAGWRRILCAPVRLSSPAGNSWR